MSLSKPCTSPIKENKIESAVVLDKLPIEDDDKVSLPSVLDNATNPDTPEKSVAVYSYPTPNPNCMCPSQSTGHAAYPQSSASNACSSYPPCDSACLANVLDNAANPDTPQKSVAVYSYPTPNPNCMSPSQSTGGAAYPQSSACNACSSYPPCDSAINSQVPEDQHSSLGIQENLITVDQHASPGIQEDLVTTDAHASPGIQENRVTTDQQEMDEQKIGAKWDFSPIKVSIPLYLLDLEKLKRNSTQELKDDRQGPSHDK